MAGTDESDGPRSPLHRECSMSGFGEKNLERVRAMLDSGVDPNELDTFARSALSLLCAHSGHAEAARLLLEAGADAMSQDMWGRTPLHWCADRGWLDIALMLLDNGALVNTTTKHGDTPLFWASKAGRQSLAKLLLKLGGDPLTCNNRDERALDVAADDVMRALIISKIQTRECPTEHLPYSSNLQKSEEKISEAQPPASSGCKNTSIQGEESLGKNFEDLKRSSPDEPSNNTAHPNNSAAFSLYSKQPISSASGPKKLKIRLKKK